jgi:hypothetical protein
LKNLKTVFLAYFPHPEKIKVAFEITILPVCEYPLINV